MASKRDCVVGRRVRWRVHGACDGVRNGVRVACAWHVHVRGVCMACAQRVRNVCATCAWRVHLGPRRTSPGKKAVAASAESSTRVPAGRGGAAAAGGGGVGGGHRGRRGTSRGERGQCEPSTSASAGAGGGARIGSVALAAARVEGRQMGPRFSRAGTLVRTLAAAQRQHLVRLGRLGLWAQARRRHGR